MNEVKRGEIYYADLSPVVGSEQDGIRPVLVLQNDVGNRHSPTTSRQTKQPLPTHVPICAGGLKAGSMVLLEQIRTIDKSRLGEYVGRLDEATMNKVDCATIQSLGVSFFRGVLDEQ